MSVAVLCDIHGNLPALDAIIAELRAEAVVVVGGDADAVAKRYEAVSGEPTAPESSTNLDAPAVSQVRRPAADPRETPDDRRIR